MVHKLKALFTLNNGVLLIAAIVTLSWVWGTVEAIQKNFVLQQQVDGLAQQVAFQELENQTLEFQKKYYQTDEFLELSARERLNLAAPDEKVLILPPNTVQPASAELPSESIIPLTQRSNYQQWLYFLFGDKS